MLRIKATQFRRRKSTAILSAATLLLALATAASSANAQEPPDSPPVIHLPGSSPPPPGGKNPGADVDSPAFAEDPIAHKNAEKLAELYGVRQTLEQNFPKSMQYGLEELRRRYPNLDSRFVAEWEKRMRAEFNPDDYIAVFVSSYEKHYTADELEEMIQALRARKNSQPVKLSPQLIAKMKVNAIDVQSEIMGGFTEIGARQGGEIGTEIGREHPDWVRNMNPAAAPAEE